MCVIYCLCLFGDDFDVGDDYDDRDDDGDADDGDDDDAVFVSRCLYVSLSISVHLCLSMSLSYLFLAPSFCLHLFQTHHIISFLFSQHLLFMYYF